MGAKLRVIPNPYSALDADGNPAGAFQLEGIPGQYVGARVDYDGRDPGVGAALAGADTPRARFSFREGAVEVPATGHYLYGLRTGELIAADEETSQHAGRAKFVAPESALDAAKARAAAEFRATTGREPPWAVTTTAAEAASQELS